MIRKTFTNFYDDNEMEIIDMASDSDKTVIEFAMELYEDYLESCDDLEY